MTTTTPAPNRGQVKVWGTTARPKWSVTVTDGATDEELARLVDQAVTTFRLVAQRLAATPAEGGERTREQV